MKIEILGPGCARCKQLAANAEQAVRELGLDASVEKVDDVREIARRGLMSTPGLFVDGRIKASGKVLSPAEIRTLLAG